MSSAVFDVAIIGCGPAGATLANLLGQYGLSVLVLEREADIYPLPRAIHFDGEVMRVFETAGLRPEVERISRPGRRSYVSADSLPRIQRGLGLAVVSTSKGLLPDREARKQGVGGEVICVLW